MTKHSNNTNTATIAHRHLRFGCWALLFFLATGIVLESLHGFKVGWYMDVDNSARRLLMRLGHAHGTLLAVVNIVFALVMRVRMGPDGRRLLIASACLICATLMLPGGFLLGGIFAYPETGDPGLATIILSPVGGLLLLISVLLFALSANPGDSSIAEGNQDDSKK